MSNSIALAAGGRGGAAVNRPFTYVTYYVTYDAVIRTFRHKGLSELFETGASARVRPDLIERTRRRLDALHRAGRPQDLNVPGFGLHKPRGVPER